MIDDSIYNCNFSLDGQKFLISTQRGMMIYSYKDSNEEMSMEMNLEADINGYDISWTITDADLSDNKRFLIHSTLNPLLHCFDLVQMKYTTHFNLAPEINPSHFFYDRCPVFSIKISGDNNELIAGCGKTQSGNNMKIFNIEKNKVTHNIKAHDQDINSICYLDRNSSAILLSASDDCYGKVWDLRALGMNQTCAGYLIGHHSGLTSISSRGDHVYCATNSKDQSLKLWDLRKLESEKNKKVELKLYDYRNDNLSMHQLQSFKKMTPEQHFDNSINTFYGHTVLRTLIRCHFSPEFGTNNRFIYSGSACGRVFIWDIFNGKCVAELSVRRDSNIVRDCVWHPYKPMLMMTNLNGLIFKWERERGISGVKIEGNQKEKDKETSFSYVDSEGDEFDN